MLQTLSSGMAVATAFVGALTFAGPELEAFDTRQGGRGGAQSENLRVAQQAIRDGKDAEALAAVRKEAAANPTSTQAANLLDTLGQGTEARAIFQRIADSAPTPAAKAAAHRGIAMSYAFEGDCANTIKYEEMVIAYWKTRESAEPQNAFYQEGEMANEGARVCFDYGDYAMAEKYYRMGSELGLKEPAPKTHPKSLWDYRLAHALGRLAARRGDAAEAHRQIADARRLLESDPAMAEQQARFLPYLEGYVALFLNDLPTAVAKLEQMIGTAGNTNDPFMNMLLGMAYEKQGNTAKATEIYQKAYRMATAHNPPAAYARPFLRKKLGM